MIRIYTLLVAVALLIGWGCSRITVSKEAEKFIGTWVGTPELSEADMQEARQTMSDEGIRNMQEIMTMEMELFGDGTYRMIMPMFKIPFKDTWSFDGNTLTLASSGASGSTRGSGKERLSDLDESDMVPNKEPMHLTVEADGEELVWNSDPAHPNSGFIFRRK